MDADCLLMEKFGGFVRVCGLYDGFVCGKCVELISLIYVICSVFLPIFHNVVDFCRRMNKHSMKVYKN